MKSFALVAVTIAGVAVAQPVPNNPFAAQGQPLCAVNCLRGALFVSGCVDMTDLSCLCKKQNITNLIGAGVGCIKESCSEDDAVKSRDAGIQSCAVQFGVN